MYNLSICISHMLKGSCQAWMYSLLETEKMLVANMIVSWWKRRK